MADKGKRKNATTINICSYNVRSIADEDDLQRLVEQTENIKWDIVGLCETYRKGEGSVVVKNGHMLFEAGKTEERPKTKGLAFLIHRNIKDKISNTKIHSDRIIRLDINLEKQEQMTIFMVHAPTSSAN